MPFEIDALIVGGGVTGLWLRALLKEYGRSVVLIESDALGAGQTIASQGIIHNGAKYAAQWDELREAAWVAPAISFAWRQHLSGENSPDLSDTTVVSEESWYWNPSDQLPKCLDDWWEEYHPSDDGRTAPPALLKSIGSGVRRNDEIVISTATMLANLAGRDRQALMHVPANRLEWTVTKPGTVDNVRITHPASEELIDLRPRIVYLTAGAGNAALREKMGLPGDSTMQRRPLRMGLIRGDLPVFCGHWFDERGPRLTVSTQFDAKGNTIWQLGGRLAENADDVPKRFLRRARHHVRQGLPDADLTNVEWSTYTAIRAEPRTHTGDQPALPEVMLEGNVVTMWPTKLSLMPYLMIDIRRAFDAAGDRAPATVDLPDWPQPKIAKPPWETVTEWISDREVARTG